MLKQITLFSITTCFIFQFTSNYHKVTGYSIKKLVLLLTFVTSDSFVLNFIAISAHFAVACVVFPLLCNLSNKTDKESHKEAFAGCR